MDAPSQYHDGEKWVQRRAGLEREAEELEGMVTNALSGSMSFRILSTQSVIVVATEVRGEDLIHVDLVFGLPGFAQPHPTGSLVAFDPRKLRGSTATNGEKLPPALATEGARVGLLALDAPNRRRFRVNGVVEEVTDGPGCAAVSVVKVLEAFPNCPKYIHAWVVTINDDSQPVGHTMEDTSGTAALTKTAIDLLAEADMFFVGTRHAASGLDASHKGGPCGVVEVLGRNRVRYPDYVGNNMFCSLGNIHVDPTIGLAVVAWHQRRVVHISGRATLQFEADDPANQTGGTRRFVVVEVTHCRVSSLPATVQVTEGQRNPLIPKSSRPCETQVNTDANTAASGGVVASLKRFVRF